MNFNLDQIMRPSEHLAALDLADPARDSVADRHLAVVAEIDDFVSQYAEDYGHWQLLLPPLLPEIRTKAELLLADYRVTYASDPSDELPYGAQISSEYDQATITQAYTPDLPTAVPVGVFRSNLGGRPTIERHYAFGSKRLADIAADAVTAASEDRGCDLRMFRPAGLHDSVTKRSGRFVWPIPCGEHLVFLRYCSECLGALLRDCEIGKTEISTPWTVG